MGIILTALALIAASGLPSVCLRRRPTAAAAGGAFLMVAGAVFGLLAAVWTLAGRGADGGAVQVRLPVGQIHLVLDPLAAFFLVPICLVGAAGTVYGLGYWPPKRHPRSGPRVRLFYGWLVAALGFVVLSADGVGFLFAWEVMALSAFMLVSAEDHRRSVRQAGWLYLVATHLGTLLLIAFFALLQSATGSFEIRPLAAAAGTPALRTILFLLALVGFGCKAGIMPLHFWLPDAHANAPTHVSALLSGVVIKMGIYGIIRVGVFMFPDPPLSWGVVALGLGVCSAVLGVAFALGQHDLKRLLAYHSIENIGIILMGLGVALLGAATHHPIWSAMGLAGCLLHVWNHALFKPLLFLSAGGVIARGHTRQIDRLGGLAKAMPWTAGAFLLGAVAICGLPPLNGFVSEWLVYLGLLGPYTGAAPASYAIVGIAVPALALVGALAVACFVKVYGTVFLGTARGRVPEKGEVPATMLVPMGILAAACLTIGVAPAVGVAAVSPVVRAAAGDAAGVGTALAPAGALHVWILVVAGVLLGAVGLMYLGLARRRVETAETWGCGYTRPTARMQYTSSSFAASILELFRWVLRPHVAAARPEGLFPATTAFWSHVGDVVLDGWLIPAWSGTKSLMVNRRVRQQGSVQRYIVYICLALLALLLTLLPWARFWDWLLARG